ncbi:MAG: 4Fe-4S binding protein [Proteobacteria bacterium]|nr:4Fe-4S binding protein [Pseudomonadota bacterium]
MMTRHALNEKYRKATKVVCGQGMFPFQVSDTAINIIKRVVKSEQELDFICAFSKTPSQTPEQLMNASGFTEQKIKSLDTPEDWVLPSQTIEDIINKFDDIAVGYCFCRQRRNLLGDACATKAPTLNCFTFGKSARHTIAQGFAKQITRQKALDIMKDAENAGLIHKAFHPGSRESSFETSICNCCKDCCDTFNLWRNGTLPMINSTFHLSVIDTDACTGCGICGDFCPTDAITLENDEYAVRQENSCIGCGVCARFCPEKAISLKEGFRRVFVAPPQPCA